MPRVLRIVGILLITLGSWTERPMAQTHPSGPPPGVLVDIGGHKLHLRCVGPAGEGPTVVLEAGGGGSSSSWAAVQELLSTRVRSCAYDRAGLGWSEPGPAPRTMRQEVFELHALLRAAGVPGPFVLVGQSIGGLLVRLYTEQYDSDVAGMVLVDPTHENDMLYNLRVGRWVHLRELATGRPIPEPVREGRPSTQYNPADDYQAEEFQQIFLSRKADPQPLGNRPLIVLAAGKRPPPPGTPEEFWKKLRQEKDEQKVDLTHLSRNSNFVLDPASGHDIEIDNPQLVAHAIEEVVEAVSTGVRLVP
jgi:pimeloyl-ACP methyl ester carboxylesterase